MKLSIKDQNGQAIDNRSLDISEKMFKIGRSEECDITLNLLSISREHLQIQGDENGNIQIQDLHSTFGTFVNGKKIQPGLPVRISLGDRVQLSEEITLTFEYDDGEKQPGDSLIDSETTIFPFFMSQNERIVKESFSTLRAKIPESNHADLKSLETDISEKVRELSAFVEVSFALNSLFNYQKVLEYAIDMALKVTGAERGFLMLYNEEIDRLETMVMRKMGNEVERDMKASFSLVLKCFKGGETLVIGDTSIDPSISKNESILMNRIRSVALTPLRIKNSTIGVLYLDNRVSPNTFNDRVQDILKVFAAQASVAIHNARLFHQATTDGLTGLTNHKHFQQRLLEEFCRATRHGKTLSLLMVDIDHFKAINDRFGHQAGDRALRGLSKLLRGNIRVHDLPARYGGEEFVVLLPEADEDGAKVLAEKLREVVEKMTFTVGELKINFTISVGVATVSPKMTRPSDLIKTADKALYQAKESGRNRVCLGNIQN